MDRTRRPRQLKQVYGITGLILLISALYTGCYYDNAAEMYPAAALNTNCDTAGVMTFDDDVLPIFQASCGAKNNSCHTPALAEGGVVLSNYNQAASVDNVTMIGCIEHLTNFNPMPPTGKLDTCSITIIQKWIDEGKQEN